MGVGGGGGGMLVAKKKKGELSHCACRFAASEDRKKGHLGPLCTLRIAFLRVHFQGGGGEWEVGGGGGCGLWGKSVQKKKNKRKKKKKKKKKKENKGTNNKCEFGGGGWGGGAGGSCAEGVTIQSCKNYIFGLSQNVSRGGVKPSGGAPRERVWGCSGGRCVRVC